MRGFMSRLMDLLEISIGILIFIPVFGFHKLSEKLYKKGIYKAKFANNKVVSSMFSIGARVGYVVSMTLLYFLLFSFLYIVFNFPIPDFVINLIPDWFLSSDSGEVLNSTKEVIESSNSWYSYFKVPAIVAAIGFLVIATSSPNDGAAMFMIMIGIFFFIFIVSTFIGLLRWIF